MKELELKRKGVKEMFIMTRTEEVIVNVDNVSTRATNSAENNLEIGALCNDGNIVTIGRYTTARRAKEVMQLIKKAIQDKVTVFEMP